MANELKNLTELRQLLKDFRWYHELYLQFFPGARVVKDRLLVHCPIPSHGHSGRGQAGLSIDLTRGLFHCFSRDDGGDIFKFYMHMYGITFAEAARKLHALVENQPAPLSGSCTLENQSDFPETHDEPLDNKVFVEICTRFLAVCESENQSEGRKYLIDRGISAAAIDVAGIRYFPANSYGRIMRQMLKSFPLSDLQKSGIFSEAGKLTFYRHRLLFPFFIEGRVCYIQARSISDETNSRWHNLRGSIPSLFNGDSLNEVSSGSIVFLVEGITDTLTLITHHFQAVGIVGASGFKEDWLGQLGRFSVVCVLDSDAAGDAAASRYQALFATRGQHLARIRLPLDINDYFKAHSTAAIELALIAEAAIEKSQQNWQQYGRDEADREVKRLPLPYDVLEIPQKRHF